MSKCVGVLVMEHIAVGVVENNQLVGPVSLYPEKGTSLDALQSMPSENIDNKLTPRRKARRFKPSGSGFPE
jgi:hypothetical protein